MNNGFTWSFQQRTIPGIFCGFGNIFSGFGIYFVDLGYIFTILDLFYGFGISFLDLGSISWILDIFSGFGIYFLDLGSIFRIEVFSPAACSDLDSFSKKIFPGALGSFFPPVFSSPAFSTPAFFQVFGLIQSLISASSRPSPARGAAISIFIKFLPRDPQSPAHPAPGDGMGGAGKCGKENLGIQDPVFPASFPLYPHPGAAKPSRLPLQPPRVGAGGMGKSGWDFPAPNSAFHGFNEDGGAGILLEMGPGFIPPEF